jgi:predicted metal-dependent hydrolase
VTEPQIPYRVRRSSRARRVRVHVDGQGDVEVVLPARAPAAAAATAMAELRPWVERRLAEVREVRERVQRRAGTVPLLGRTLRVVPEPGRLRVARRGDALLVPEHEPELALERFYRRTARVEVAARLDRAVAATGTSYRSLSIRGQRTRWASCSSSGHMSFNWRLLLAPEPVLDYVVWHEVCHLEVLDHSPRFWALLRRRCPHYAEHAAWLRRHGATLVLA